MSTGRSRVPAQALGRAALAVAGIALLVLGHPTGGAVYLAWTLVGVAAASELVATVAWYVRGRRARDR